MYTPDDRYHFVTVFEFSVMNEQGTEEIMQYGYETRTDVEGNPTLIQEGESVDELMLTE